MRCGFGFEIDLKKTVRFACLACLLRQARQTGEPLFVKILLLRNLNLPSTNLTPNQVVSSVSLCNLRNPWIEKN